MRDFQSSKLPSTSFSTRVFIEVPKLKVEGKIAPDQKCAVPKPPQSRKRGGAATDCPPSPPPPGAAPRRRRSPSPHPGTVPAGHLEPASLGDPGAGAGAPPARSQKLWSCGTWAPRVPGPRTHRQRAVLRWRRGPGRAAAGAAAGGPRPGAPGPCHRPASLPARRHSARPCRRPDKAAGARGGVGAAASGDTGRPGSPGTGRRERGPGPHPPRRPFVTTRTRGSHSDRGPRH